jgi:hypothetical protein
VLGVDPSWRVFKYRMVLGNVDAGVAGSSPMKSMDLLSIALLSLIMVGAFHELISHLSYPTTCQNDSLFQNYF